MVIVMQHMLWLYCCAAMHATKTGEQQQCMHTQAGCFPLIQLQRFRAEVLQLGCSKMSSCDCWGCLAVWPNRAVLPPRAVQWHDRPCVCDTLIVTRMRTV
jgi:hypothetical protein